MVLVFHPEKNNCVVGYSQDIVREDTKDEDEMEGEESKDNIGDRENMEEGDDTDEENREKYDEDYEPEEPGRLHKLYQWLTTTCRVRGDYDTPCEHHAARRALVTDMFKF